MCGSNTLSNIFSARKRARDLFVLSLGLLLTAAHADASRLPSVGEWKPDSTSPTVSLHGAGLHFPCPFPDTVDRHVWDASFSNPAESMDGFVLEYHLENPVAFRGLTLFFRSGPGWLAAALPVADGPQRVWLPLTVFTAQNDPDGWHALNGIRLSPWRADQGSGAVNLLSLRAVSARVAVVLPGQLSSITDEEREFGRANANQWINDLTKIDTFSLPVEENDLNTIQPLNQPVLILPYNPYPPEAMLRTLRRYVRQGGKLVVCYNASPALATLIGVRINRWIPGKPGQFHALRFTDPDWSGPETLPQSTTPHLISIRPENPKTQTLAMWSDVKGSLTPEPALVWGNSGAWFSYLLSNGDEASRLHMLSFLLDRFLPGTALKAARHRFETAQQALAPLKGDLSPDILQQQTTLENALAEKDTAEASRQINPFVQTVEKTLALAHTLPAETTLAIWEHSGRGLYPGEWERTLDELHRAGIKDLFLYVGRQDPPPLDAVRAASPRGIRVHAWHVCYNLEGETDDRRTSLQKNGRLQVSASGKQTHWLCPSSPENRDAETQRILTLAETPGLAGVHLDYIRYPDADHCYCPGCRQRFEQESGTSLTQWPGDVRGGPHTASFLAWRARQISALVEQISQQLEQHHPGLILSAAVWPEHPAIIETLGQDWAHWASEGWIDLITPMSYTQSVGQLQQWTQHHRTLAGGNVTLWAGLGVTSTHSRLDPAQTLRQANAALEAGADGIVFFDLNPTVHSRLFPLLHSRTFGEHHD